MKNQEWKKFVGMHKKGEISTTELLQIGSELDAMDEEEKFALNLRATREVNVISGEYYLMLDQGWEHVYRKWTPEYKQKVTDFLKAVKPYFEGKTLAQMEGTNPGGLCKKGINLYDGQYFFHLYPSWGDVLAVNLILGSKEVPFLELDIL